VGGGLEATQREVARYSPEDAQRLPEYYARLDAVADVLRDVVLETPPNVGGGVRDLFHAWQTARRMKKLSMKARREVLDLFTLSAGDWLDRWFASDPIKAAFGFDSVVGNFASPYAPWVGLRAAAPRFRRGEWQEGRVGPCDRRDGGDHPGDAPRSRIPGRGDSPRPRRRTHRREGRPSLRRGAGGRHRARIALRRPRTRTRVSFSACCAT
jgi:hypothetical protein